MFPFLDSADQGEVPGHGLHGEGQAPPHTRGRETSQGNSCKCFLKDIYCKYKAMKTCGFSEMPLAKKKLTVTNFSEINKL